MLSQKGSDITVIIPVYNAEKYLPDCLNSVLSQTIKDLQVIIVDDCSKDSSPEIIRSYASRKNVIVLFNETNRGAAYCRNRALSLVTTNYVGFIDADDYIDCRYYELLYSELVRTGADIAVCDFHVVGNDSELYIEATQGGSDAFSFVNYGMAASPCNKLFRKGLIEAYPFTEGIINEDIASVIPALVHAKKICYVPQSYYHYIQHDMSVQNSRLSMKRFDIFSAVDIAIDRMRDAAEYERCRDAVIFQQLIMLLTGVLPKERRFGRRLQFLRTYNRHMAKYGIKAGSFVQRLFSNQCTKKKLFYALLLTLIRLRLSFVINCAIQAYNVYKRHRMQARLVIKPDVRDVNLIEAARRQSQLNDLGIGISVIVPNYIYARYMYQRIYSILCQGVKLQEIIILDDCSSDESHKVIEHIAASVKPYVRIVTANNDANSSNDFLRWHKGIKMAAGDYIWIAETEGYSEPSMLENLVNPVLRDRSIALSYCNAAFMDSGGYVMPDDVTKTIDLMHTGHWKSGYVNDGVDEIKRFLFLNCTISSVSSVLFKAGVALDFDEVITYRQAGDWLFYIMLMGGGKVAYTPDILNYYRMNSGNASNTTKKADALKEIIRVHQAIERKYGLDKRQNKHIFNRYSFLINNGRLKSISGAKRTRDLIKLFQGECIRNTERLTKHTPFYPKVSIIIPVFNGSNYMREAIESALTQTYSNIEVIVVNDGSTDNGMTDTIARSFGNRIRYFKKENGGVATALNFGIEKMEGEYFAWLSHDDIYAQNKISYDIEVINGLEDKTTFLVGGYSVVNEFGKRIFDVNLLNQYSQEELSRPLFVVFRGGINGCTTLIHKSHFERAGVFDPTLTTTQDYDLWFRMLRGQKVCYYNACNVKSRIHEEQGSKKIDNHIAECNQLWIRIMSSITNEERKQIDGSPFLFYVNIAKFLQNSTNYRQAIDFAKRQATLLAPWCIRSWSIINLLWLGKKICRHYKMHGLAGIINNKIRRLNRRGRSTS